MALPSLHRVPKLGQIVAEIMDLREMDKWGASDQGGRATHIDIVPCSLQISIGYSERVVQVRIDDFRYGKVLHSQCCLMIVPLFKLAGSGLNRLIVSGSEGELCRLCRTNQRDFRMGRQ